MWWPYIFSQSIAYLFILLIVFGRAVVFKFGEIQFINVFSFMDCAFDVLRTLYPTAVNKDFSCVLSQNVYCFMFYIQTCDPFWVHLCIKYEVGSFSLHMDDELVVHHHLLKRLSLQWVAFTSFTSLSKIKWPHLWIHFWSLFCCIDLSICSPRQYHTVLQYYGFVVSIKTR